METVINIGLNDTVVHALAATTNNPKYAYDTYRRSLMSYGTHVLHTPSYIYTNLLQDLLRSRNLTSESQLTTYDYQQLCVLYKNVTAIPEDPYEQIYCALVAVYESWDSTVVNMYRDIYGIPWVCICMYIQKGTYAMLNLHSLVDVQ